METDVWRWADPAGQQRIVRFDELLAALVSGVVPPNAPVWRPGWVEWRPAQDVPELTTSALSAVNGVVPNIPPPPLAVVAVQAAFEAKAGESFRPPPVFDPNANQEPPPPPRYVPVAVNPHASISGNYAAVQVPSGPPPPPVSIQPAAPFSMSPSAFPPSVVDKDDPPLASLVSQPPSKPALPSKDRTALGIGPAGPTEIGVPPPPDLALAATAVATSTAPTSPPPAPTPSSMAATIGMSPKPSSIKPPPPPSIKPPPPPAVAAEELSGSVLLDEVVAPLQSIVPPPNGALPPPTDPIQHAERFSTPGEFPAGLGPSRGPLNSLVRDFGEVKAGRPPKNKRLAIVTLVVAGSLAIVVFAIIVTLVRAIFSGDKKPAPIASTSATTTASSMPSVTPPPTVAKTDIVPPPEPPKTNDGPSFGECTASGDARSLGWRAVPNVGLESGMAGNAVGIGFASNAREGVVLTVDPSSLAISGTLKGRGLGGDVKRVSPTVAASKVVATVDTDRKGDKLANRRVVATSNPIDLGFAENAIVWAPHGKDSWAKLFALDGDGTADAIRGVPFTSGKGVAFVFRRGTSLYVGAAKGDGTLEAQGTLAKIPSLGQVGTPTIAASGDSFVVAWADRASQSDSWQIRYASFKAGELPSESKSFGLPAGGIGGQAMSPSVYGLGAGKSLLAWMEGPTSSHQIRAQVIGGTGTPEGTAITVSPQGTNAGNPSAALGADGKGVVAFLGAKKNGFEVWVMPVSCAAK